LNEEIGKEDHILQGSKKLVGATIDHKTKDQASLEMSFAESKIKALQAELAKINSSLHAYQDERFVHSHNHFHFCIITVTINEPIYYIIIMILD
jgi:hypothetical protein